PEGGSNPLGVFGYIHGAEEMATTWIHEHFGGDGPDSLFMALGSGGTLAGLYLGFERIGLPTEALCAVNVCDNREYFEMRVTKLLEDTCEKFHLSMRGPKLQIFDG